MSSIKHEKQKSRLSLSLFTIGHSNHTVGDFIELLKQNNIECLVDVRSVPYSSYQKSFSRENLQYELRKHGISYVWMGDKLGGREKPSKTVPVSGWMMRLMKILNTEPAWSI